MITKKHLKEIGFTFIDKQSAYFDSPVGRVAIIGGYLSFVDTKKVYWLEDIGYRRMVKLLRPKEAKITTYTDGPVLDKNGVLHFYINPVIAPISVFSSDQIYTMSVMSQTTELPTDRLSEAGLTKEEIDLCNQRFKESGFTDYDSWCTAYIALNTTEKAEGFALDGNLVIQSIMNSKKSSKRFSLGSYKRK